MIAALRILLVAWAVASSATGVWAQQTPSPSPPTEQRHGLAGGTIVAIDLAAKRLTVKTAEGSAVFGLASNTYIFRGKDKLTPDKLKEGDIIKLSWYRDAVGQVYVRRIKISLPESPETAP